MEDIELKKLLREYCNTFGFEFPPSSVRRKLYEKYRKEVERCDVEDHPNTFFSFLDTAEELFLKENKMAMEYIIQPKRLQ